jgi:hypothetical protein
MSTITVKTAKRNTTVTRLAVRQAVNEVYSKNGHAHKAAKTAKPISKNASKKH